jgi:hypothetical protein
MSASVPLGNYGRHRNTLESSGYVHHQFGMGDVFGNPSPFNFAETKKSELLTAPGIPQMEDASVAADEQVASVETQSVYSGEQNTTMLLIGAGIIVAAFIYSNNR